MAIERFESSLRLPAAPQPRAPEPVDLSAVTRAADRGLQTIDVLARQKRVAEVSDARTRAVGELGEIKRRYQEGRDEEQLRAGFGEDVAEMRTRIGDTLTTELAREEFDNVVNSLSAPTFNSLAEKVRRNRIGYERTNLDNRLAVIAGEAALTDDSEEREALVAQALDLISDGTVAGFVPDAASATKIGRAFLSQVDDARATRLVTDDPRAADAALAVADDFSDLDPDRRNVLRDRARRRVESLDREAELTARREHQEQTRRDRARIIETRDRARLALTMALAGERHPDEADILADAERVSAAGNVDLSDTAELTRETASELRLARSIRLEGEDFRAMPVQEQIRDVETMTKDGVKSPTELRVVDMKRQLIAATVKSVEKDFVGHLMKVGHELPALQFGDPDSWRERAETVAGHAEAFGVPDAAVLSDPEADGLFRAWNQANADDKSALLIAMVDGLGTDRARRVMQRVARQDGAGIFAAQGYIAAGFPEIGPQMVKGEELRRTADNVLPSANERGESVTKVYGTAFAGQGATEALYVKAAENVYLAMREERGELHAPFDPDLFDEALERTTGPLVDFNDSRVILPRGWDEDRLEDLMDGLQDEDLDGALAGLEPVTAEAVRDSGTLQTIGPGVYLLKFGVLGSVVTAEGEPVVLDLAALEQRIADRRASLSKAQSGIGRAILAGQRKDAPR